MTDLINLTGRSFVVIGDLMMDEYHIGTVSRISPEAPVPILSFSNYTFSAGGAANVAMNLAKLGNKVELSGVVGEDEAGLRLLELLKEEGVGTDGIKRVHGFSTIRKVRFKTDQQALLRVDYENEARVNAFDCVYLINYLQKYLCVNKVDGVLISDYDKGLLCRENRAVWDGFFSELKRRCIYCGADSKKRDHELSLYSGFDMLKPNINELYKAIGKRREDGCSIEDACLHYQKYSGAKTIFVTLGKDGIYCFDGRRGAGYHAVEANVRDTTGAGDSVFAVLLFATANGMSMGDAARLSNIAASAVIEKQGTAVITLDELRKRVDVIRNAAPEYFYDGAADPSCGETAAGE